MNTRPDSMMRRVEAYFRENPGEALTWEDMVTKFGLTSVEQAKNVIENINTHGPMRLKSVRMVVVDLGDGK